MNTTRVTRMLFFLLVFFLTFTMSPNTLAQTFPAGAGRITEYSIPGNASPEDITAGSDGNLWFTETLANKIGKITTQ